MQTRCLKAGIRAFTTHCKSTIRFQLRLQLTDRTARVEDTSVRYVAEENIEVIEPEVPFTLMSLAGKFFKRWDKENRVFMSNIRDEYPEDQVDRWNVS